LNKISVLFKDIESRYILSDEVNEILVGITEFNVPANTREYQKTKLKIIVHNINVNTD